MLNRRTFTLLLSLVLVMCTDARGADESWTPWDMSGRRPRDPGLVVGPDHPTSTAQATLLGYIRAYQLVVSPLYNRTLNPGGCNFHPSCSRFGHQALQKYGIAKGLVMTSDRLLRCHPAARLYYPARIDGDHRACDPALWLQGSPRERGVVSQICFHAFPR